MRLLFYFSIVSVMAIAAAVLDLTVFKWTFLKSSEAGPLGLAGAICLILIQWFGRKDDFF